MTTPSDFDAGHAIETTRPARPLNTNRQIWVIRIGGLVLVLFGWGITSIPHFDTAQVGLNAVAFGGLAVYAFAAAGLSRRIAVNTEKRLRLDLLVHNIELENMAMRDDLTQMFNRRYFFDRLERELQTARGFQRPLCVLLIDVDQLKAVNDTYGHRAGDEALANFGRFLLSQTRASDIPARIGGDEFAIILPDTSENAAEVMITRIQKALENTDLMDDPSLTLSLGASLGAAGYPWDGDSVDTIMQQADASMYANKLARKQSAMSGESTDKVTAKVPTAFRKSAEPEGS